MTKTFEEEFEKFKLTAGASPKHKKIINHFKDWQPQQPLPVVPEFIGKLINTFGAPEDGKYINYAASYPENKKELDWIDNHQKTWLTALLVGFTVEKPQLFYLKNKFTNSYLCQYPSDKSFYHLVVGVEDGVSKLVTKFTQQEIDSMQTGSYDLVPVEDGE